MSLKDIIQSEIKKSLLNGDKEIVKILRLITASIKQQEVDKRIILDDNQIITVLDKMLKQRRDSFQQYQAANRQDLADKESFEIEIINKFMPEAIDEGELIKIIDDAIKQTSSQTMKDIGKIITIVKPKVQGRVDMAQVSEIIKSKLS